jgi:hypothetical protein
MEGYFALGRIWRLDLVREWVGRRRRGCRITGMGMYLSLANTLHIFHSLENRRRRRENREKEEEEEDEEEEEEEEEEKESRGGRELE